MLFRSGAESVFIASQAVATKVLHVLHLVDSEDERWSHMALVSIQVFCQHKSGSRYDIADG